jgi:hypothetical protein
MKIYLVMAITVICCCCAIYLLLIKRPEATILTDDSARLDQKENHHTEEAPSHEAQDLPQADLKDGKQNSYPRDQEVASRLERFLQKTANITEALVRSEREKLSRGLTAALDKQTETPHVEIGIDDEGSAWEEIRYSNGMVRYFPAPEGAGTN